jgi:hypothetical protein
VGVIISKKFGGKVVRFRRDLDGRIIAVDLEVGQQKIRVVNVYAPNNVADQKEFFKNLDLWCVGAHTLVLGGDFNCVEDPQKDRFGFNTPNDPSRAELVDLTTSLHLEDSWRVVHGARAGGWTWSARNSASRIDRLYVSSSASREVGSVRTESSGIISDHKMVVMEMECPGLAVFGPGAWRLNTSLLEDTTTKNEILNFLVRRFAEADRSLAWWATVKDGAKKIFQKNGRRLAREERDIERGLGIVLDLMQDPALRSPDQNIVVAQVKTAIHQCFSAKYERLKNMVHLERWQAETSVSRRVLVDLYSRWTLQIHRECARRFGATSRIYSVVMGSLLEPG